MSRKSNLHTCAGLIADSEIMSCSSLARLEAKGDKTVSACATRLGGTPQGCLISICIRCSAVVTTTYTASLQCMEVHQPTQQANLNWNGVVEGDARAGPTEEAAC